MEIDIEKAVKFILRAMMNKQGYKGSFAQYLRDNGLAADEAAESQKKLNVRTNVKLFQSEIDELKRFYTEDELNSIYDKLSNYKLSNGKKYKSDYGAINTWVIESTLGGKKKVELNKHIKHWNE
jgi:hypothetical protein